jgi:hypothetical protein
VGGIPKENEMIFTMSKHMKPIQAFCFLTSAAISLCVAAEIRVPAFSAYLEPDSNGAWVSEAQGITG